jgi:hypothetical protein
MDKLNKVKVVFDYTTFLGASCDKKWTFLEAISSFSPHVHLEGKDAEFAAKSPQERLWENALRLLSTCSSDETNLVMLVELAKMEGIDELQLMMPYPLDEGQLQQISSQSHSHIEASRQDVFIIQI